MARMKQSPCGGVGIKSEFLTCFARDGLLNRFPFVDKTAVQRWFSESVIAGFAAIDTGEPKWMTAETHANQTNGDVFGIVVTHKFLFFMIDLLTVRSNSY